MSLGKTLNPQCLIQIWVNVWWCEWIVIGVICLEKCQINLIHYYHNVEPNHFIELTRHTHILGFLQLQVPGKAQLKTNTGTINSLSVLYQHRNWSMQVLIRLISSRKEKEQEGWKEANGNKHVTERSSRAANKYENDFKKKLEKEVIRKTNKVTLIAKVRKSSFFKTVLKGLFASNMQSLRLIESVGKEFICPIRKQQVCSQ